MRRTRLAEKYVLRSGYGLYYGAFENRGGNPSLGYNYPFQFTLVYLSPNATAPNRLGDGSLVGGLDARDRIVLDPANVNANGLDPARRRVRLQDAAIPQLQRDAPDGADAESLHRGRIRRAPGGDNLETFTGMNNVTVLLPPGTNPQPYVDWPDFARGSLLRPHGRRELVRFAPGQVPPPVAQRIAVPGELHAERGQDQRG